MGKYLRNRAVAQRPTGEIEQPANLVQRSGCQPLLLGFYIPFFGDRPERVRRRNAGRDLVQLGLLARIAPAGQQFSRCIALRPGACQIDVRPYTKGQSLVFSEMAIVHPPIALAGRQNEEMQSAGIGQLVLLVAALCRLDRNRRQSDGGITPSPSGDMPPIIPSNWQDASG